MMSRVTKEQFAVQSTARKIPWPEKIEKGFFRGRDSRQERLDLAEMSQKNSAEIDAAITAYFFFRGLKMLLLKIFIMVEKICYRITIGLIFYYNVSRYRIFRQCLY